MENKVYPNGAFENEMFKRNPFLKRAHATCISSKISKEFAVKTQKDLLALSLKGGLRKN